MRNFFQLSIFIFLSFTICRCNSPSGNSNTAKKEPADSSRFSTLGKQLLASETENPFSLTLTPEKTNYYLPAIQSFAHATYNGLWIIIGGQVVGFHGTSNNPQPFLTSFANDSMWVIDVANEKTYGVPIPKEYWNALAITNPQSYQVGSDLYLCGGYTVSDASQTRFNTTSNYFFKINLPSLVTYVQSAGKSPALSQVFPIVIKNNFVQVAGGELLVVKNNFYLIGGQDYEGAYSAGVNGKYTNAIRSFTLAQNGAAWTISNMNSLVDSVNLHRRDFNLVPYIAEDGSLEGIIFGGVFTSTDLCYNNPVFIKGLGTGQPSITIGTMQQKCNQYTCALAPMFIYQGAPMLYGMIGGITYMDYDAATHGIIVGGGARPMPFSKLIDFMVTDDNASAEFVQIPPQPELPGYLGSNAVFIPSPKFTADGYENILDLNKVFTGNSNSVNIGYMYGGILSNGPTSGTTPQGNVMTYANPVLYSVTLDLDLTKMQKSTTK